MFRFSPSLSGDIRLGTLRVALFNYISAIQADDKLILRIDDTDKTEDSTANVAEMVEMLSLFGISFSDITYHSHNLKFHQQLATKLLMDNNAFNCFCPPTPSDEPYNGTCENLHDDDVINNESPFCVRIKHANKEINFTDKIKAEQHFSKDAIDSFVILNVDKSPTYNFACALDDLLSDISVVICEDVHLADTPKQILVHNYLGYDKEIVYAHLPSIVDDISVKSLLEEGFLPQAIVNYLIMIGNKPPIEIFDIQEAVTWFDLSTISNTPSTIDIEKLRQINRAHIKRLAPLELAKFIGYSSKDLGELAKIYTEEGSTINEIKPKIDAIFAKKEPLSFQEECATLVNVAKEAPYFKEFCDFEAHLKTETGLEGEKLLTPLRLVLTGAENGPNLRDIYPHIKNYLGEIIQ